MSDKFVLSPGEAYHLDKAFVRAGYRPGDVTKLRQGEVASAVLQVLRGRAKITPYEHLIDCRIEPKAPEGTGWILYNHSSSVAYFPWDSSEVWLLNPEPMLGSEVQNLAWVQQWSPMPANVLEYLLAHQELIPPEWADTNVYFFGTTYVDGQERELVRCLFRDIRGIWQEGRRFLDQHWEGNIHVAMHTRHSFQPPV
jgi:hypothetical protein